MLIMITLLNEIILNKQTDEEPGYTIVIQNFPKILE